MSMKKISALCAISATTLAASAGLPIEWASPVDGNWNTAANWNPAVVPLLATAELGMTGAYTVTYDTSSTISGLNITNPDAQLGISGVRTLTMLGNVNNEGTIVVNPGGINATTGISFDLSASVDGSGTMLLNSTTTRARLQTFNDAVVTHGASHTIEGIGQIAAEMINNGTIDANVSSIEMLVNTFDKTNNATMRASNGGIMDISGITLTQSASGDLFADGAGSQIEITNSTVSGGDLMSINSGDVEILGTSTLDGVTHSGVMNIPGISTLRISNSIENNGIMTLNSNVINATTTIRFLDSSAFNGNGTLTLANTVSRARVQTDDPGMTITNGAAHTIEGRGQIEAPMINEGTIHANVDTQELLLNLNPKTNNALMQATNGAILDVNATTISQSASGDIVADGVGSQIEITGSTVSGGDLTSINGADLEILGTSTLDGVTHSGIMNIPGVNTLLISNSIENNGIMTLNSNVINATTSIRFLDSGAFNGNGTLVLNNTVSRARVQSDAKVVVTNGAAHTIQGRGQIEADMINDGLISADVSGNELLLNINDKLNNETMQAVDGAVLDIVSITLTQDASGELISDGAGSEIELSGSTVDGGMMTSLNDGIFEIQGASHLRDVDMDGELQMPGVTTLGIGTGTLNNGLIVVNANTINATTSLVWDDEFTLEGNGTIRLNNTFTRARLIPGVDVTQGALGSGQRLEGVGRIEIDLINHGTIAPGLSVGTMTATQPVSNSSSAVFEAEVNESGADLLDSNNPIEIGGSLEVSYVDGFAPTGFWVRTIMEGSEITGSFDSFSAPTPPAGKVFRYFNTGTELLVGATCAGDTDLNNLLDIFDVITFIALFNAEDPRVDYQPDGIFDIFDVIGFINAFNAVDCDN